MTWFSRIPAVIRMLSAMVLAALVLCLGWTAWVLTGGSDDQRGVGAVKLLPELGAWQLAAGSGDLTEQGFAVTRPGPRGQTLVLIELPDRLQTARFSRVEVRAVDRLPSSLTLVWSASESFRQTGSQAIERVDEVVGQALIAGHSDWQGEIFFLAIEQSGFVSGSWTIESLILHPHSPGFLELQQMLWASFFSFDPWAQRNPNFIRPLDAPLQVWPVLTVALWIMLSAGFMLLFDMRPARTAAIWFILPAVIGWALLDLRWQAELMYKAQRTYSTFAGVPKAERFSLDLDGAFFDFLDRLQTEHERSEFRRVFAISEFEFLRKRARFHLAAWAVREAPASAMTPALSSLLEPDDLILLLDTPELRIRIGEDGVVVRGLEGQLLIEGELVLQQREWLALRVL